MSDETALVPIDQRTVQFYEDKITAAMVDAGGRHATAWALTGPANVSALTAIRSCLML
jgi:hypothetical protein